MRDSRPIGVFDSGVGGITVLQELRRQVPDERLVYLADLECFPYGPRPAAEVRERALAIVAFLASLDTKLVVIACNTATAVALNAARERFDIPVVGVIAPGAQAAVAATRNHRIAVISTEGTLRSGEYVHAIREANPRAVVLGRAAPELVDIVEAGDADSARADAALGPIAREVEGWDADTLVLGCTHYPLLRPSIARVLRDGIAVIDSAETTAARVARILAVNRLEAPDQPPSQPVLLVTGPPAGFAERARRVFGEEVGEPERVSLAPPLQVAG